MLTMQAAVWYGPGRENFRLEQVNLPDLNPGEVLIKVQKCFFSAMHVRAVLVGHPKHQPPKIFGRMLAGEVVAVGADVTSIKEGMRVTINPERPCGECFYCQLGEWGHCLNPTTLASGGMAEYVSVPATLVEGIFELPPEIAYEEGAYAETLACILQAMDSSNIAASDCVVIVGDGSVGLTFVQLARLQNAAKIIFAGKHDDSLQQGLALGAFRTVNVKHESLPDVVMRETQGYGADVVIEAVGSGETYEQALTLLRCGGRAVGFGGTPPGTKFPGDPNLIHYRSLKIYGSYRYNPDHFSRALDLICTKQIDLGPIITHYVPFFKLTTDAVDISQQPDCRALVIDFGQELCL
jgi:L-iditol 2-dehydrogenase